MRMFWRFAAFFRCFQVVIVCTPDLLSQYHSSVIRSSPKDYPQKPAQTLDTPRTIPILMAASYFRFPPLGMCPMTGAAPWFCPLIPEKSFPPPRLSDLSFV